MTSGKMQALTYQKRYLRNSLQRVSRLIIRGLPVRLLMVRKAEESTRDCHQNITANTDGTGVSHSLLWLR